MLHCDSKNTAADEDDDAVDWLDFLFVCDVLLVLCVVALCLARCCQFCRCKEGRERRKSQFAFFDRVDP